MGEVSACFVPARVHCEHSRRRRRETKAQERESQGMIQYLYLTLCVLGTSLPCSQLIPFLAEHGLDVPLMIEQLFANRISAFFGLDVIVSSIVLWVLVITEGRRQQMKHLWVYIICNLAVGVSLGLPLFLYMRERKIAARSDLKQATA